jgi:arylsulfatase A-like enzyme
MAITGAALHGQSSSTKPNIVIILTDDQGWGDLSIHGNTNLQTPNIDRLAKGGARFNNFFVSPVCSPTRAEFLTGRYHPRTGVYSTSAGGERMDLDEQTIAQVFKAAGYSTAMYGKWHNGMQYPYHPNARGFEDFYGFCSGHWGDYFSPQLEHNGKLVEGKGFIIDDLTDKAIQFIEDNKEGPFLLYLPYNTPHSPMQVPDRWWNKFKDKELELRHGDEEDLLFTRAALAMCENIDWNVGRLMERLKALRLEENTIVLYFHDNGPNSWRWNGGMKGRKGSTDDGGVRSPLFIRWPGKIEPGKNIASISAAIDLLPTLTDLAGIDPLVKKPLDGMSLKPLLLENQPAWPDRMIFNHWDGKVSVRTQQYRLDHSGKLFDMQRDQGQRQNIANQMLPVAEKLSAEVQRWREEVLSELPTSDTRSFPLGHPDTRYTQLPARDGQPHGNIKRSNRFPNASFFTNWIHVEDKISWNIEVVESGDFEVVLYYTCPQKDAGSTVELSFGESRLKGHIAEGFDPPLRGMENDRVERTESYVKDFKALNLGVVHLEKGEGQLTLQALRIPGSTVMDFRLLMFERVE